MHLSGTGLSSHSVSLSELPKSSAGTALSGSTVVRQRLSQRENSKDSAFDGSTISVGDDDVSLHTTRSSVITSGSASVKPSQATTTSKTECPASPGLAPKSLPPVLPTDKYSS